MTGFTDVHHHLIYGLDDGPRRMEDMTAMLRRAAAEGITTLIATPHVTPGVRPFDRDVFQARLQEARQFCAAQGLPLSLHAGAELLYTPQTARFLREGRVPTLGNTPYALVEFSPDVRFDTLESAIAELLRNGFLPVLAHMERYACLTHNVKRTIRLKQTCEVYYQVNCSTILGRYGFWANRCVDRLLKEHLVDFVATDAHNTDARRAHMKRAHRALQEKVGPEYAAALTGVADSEFKRMLLAADAKS